MNAVRMFDEYQQITMQTPITGIHHVTAIASDPQQNVDFYTKVLGLRLVKRTVNFDDPTAYHLYYGDTSGRSGSIITFFFWPGSSQRGRIGSGQVSALTFSVAPSSLSFWQSHLREHGVKARCVERLGEKVLQFEDPDHIPVEIVGVGEDLRTGWSGAGISAEHALRGLHCAELRLSSKEATAELLVTRMGFKAVGEDGNRTRYAVGAGRSGSYADIVIDTSAPHGTDGCGTVHHVAWSVADEAAQTRVREEIRQTGALISVVRDRTYFQSIYYREPGRILFEIATQTPGFTVDEPLERLGEKLQLPPQFASRRSEIERALPALQI